MYDSSLVDSWISLIKTLLTDGEPEEAEEGKNKLMMYSCNFQKWSIICDIDDYFLKLIHSVLTKFDNHAVLMQSSDLTMLENLRLEILRMENVNGKFLNWGGNSFGKLFLY